MRAGSPFNDNIVRCTNQQAPGFLKFAPRHMWESVQSSEAQLSCLRYHWVESSIDPPPVPGRLDVFGTYSTNDR